MTISGISVVAVVSGRLIDYGKSEAKRALNTR